MNNNQIWWCIGWPACIFIVFLISWAMGAVEVQPGKVLYQYGTMTTINDVEYRVRRNKLTGKISWLCCAEWHQLYRWYEIRRITFN